MKKNNLNIVKIDKNKSLFNYEKKILIKELILDLKLGYYEFEKEKTQKNKNGSKALSCRTKTSNI
jgi:dihydroneopterin aldolase